MNCWAAEVTVACPKRPSRPKLICRPNAPQANALLDWSLAACAARLESEKLAHVVVASAPEQSMLGFRICTMANPPPIMGWMCPSIGIANTPMERRRTLEKVTFRTPLWELASVIWALAGLVKNACSYPRDRAVRFPVISQITDRSEEHTSELQSHVNLVCRLLLE